MKAPNPPPDPSRPSSRSVERRIRDEIASSGPIPFARFMELALYDPDGGYYACGPQRVGPSGDFVTASDVGRGFGRSLARQLQEADRVLGPFDPFDVVELGAGRGLLAADVLEAAAEADPAFATRLRYTMVDRSAGMRTDAANRTPGARTAAPDEAPQGIRGAVVAVELFDALPVHRVRCRGGRLVELRVDRDAAGRLVEVEWEPTPEVEALARRYGAAAQEGQEAEVAPAALAQIDAIAGILERGLALVVDYGDLAEELYAEDRPLGTLLAYHGHRTNQNYLERIGSQDLTAHVNFSALRDRAVACGFDVLTFTTQDRFLVANGILELFDAPDDGRPGASSIKTRLQAMHLIHPHAMGRRFKVLALSRGIRPPPTLAGLADPFARS